jgi:DNA polymerase-3 subunit epsilon
MESFVAIDFETANQYRQSACEWGFSVWKDGAVVNAQGILLQPPAPYDYFDPFNVSLHGITAEMAAEGVGFERVLEKLAERLRKVPVVAHNAGFDLSVIRKTCEHLDIPYPEMNYYCTLVLARRSFRDDPEVVSFKLESLIEHIGYEWDQEHSAANDAQAAGYLAVFLMEKHGVDNLQDLAQELQVSPGLMGPGIDARSISKAGRTSKWVSPEELTRRVQALKQFAAIDSWDPSGDFDGKHVKFTGSFSRPKADYEAALEECGGVPTKAVSKKTNFIVEGAQAPDQQSDGGSKAQREARRMKAAGAEIEILDEDEFLRLLTD